MILKLDRGRLPARRASA